MMSIRELVELILEFNGWDFRQTAEDIGELYMQLKLAPSQLLGEFEDICFKENKCPNCGHELKFYTYTENRGEFWGEPVTETMNIVGCPNCGFIVE